MGQLLSVVWWLFKSESEIHNEAILEKCEKGDLIEFPREIYSHWGVYVGGGQVIHLICLEENIVECCNPVTGAKRGEIKEELFMKVAGTSKAKINNYKDKEMRRYSPVEIVKRAKRYKGKIKYKCGGCEIFATWCRYGKGTSKQVENAEDWILLTVLGLALYIIYD